MEGELVTSNPSSDDEDGDGESRQLSFSSYTEKLDYYCSYYMSIGMSYTDYWDGDNELPRFYREAEKHRIESANTLAWIQGMYVYEAILDSAPALNSMAKNHKPHEYRRKPLDFDLFGWKKRADYNKKKMNNGISFMESVMSSWNSKFKKKGGKK